MKDHLTHITAYTYDAAGNLRSLTDANTQESGFAYNALGRLEQESRPLGQTTAYVYNAAGKLETKTDAKNQRTEYIYEPGSNLLTDIYYFNSSNTQTGHVTFSYERGQLSGYSSCTDAQPCVSATYTYNAFGQKESETVNYPPALSAVEGFSKTFRYGYGSDGSKQYFSMPDGTTYTYTYDSNELRTIQIPGMGNIAYPSYTMGRPDSVIFPGGTRTYTYDALLRTTNITAPGMNYSYPLYDNAGNILTKQTEHGTYGYGYDDLYRLTGANAPAANESYDYDPVGNRLSASGVVGPIQHNQNNELRQYGGASFDYDPNGNLTSETTASGTRQYIYNVQNRLIRVEENGQLIAEYGYDPFGRRLWKDVSGTRTYFLYSDEGLIAEYDTTGNELRSYGYRPDSNWSTDPLWLKEGGAYYWYQNDHLGIPQKLVDSAGVVVWSATYSAFGEATISIEAVTNNLRFPGQYVDAETGWHYNFHRYYDPGTGRYTRVDPIGFHGGDVNLYIYALSNPIIYIDEYGFTGKLSVPTPEEIRRRIDLRNFTLQQVQRMQSNGAYTDCMALASIIRMSAGANTNAQDLINDLQAVLIGDGLNSDEGRTSSIGNFLVSRGFGESGFDPSFQDPTFPSNQVQHAVAGLVISFRYTFLSRWGVKWLEGEPEDDRLYDATFSLGCKLDDDNYPTLSARVLQQLCAH